MHDRIVTLREALTNFVDSGATQSQAHIKLLHWHIAERLVIEGGFDPDDVIPRPPLRVEALGSGSYRRFRLHHDPAAAKPGELRSRA